MSLSASDVSFSYGGRKVLDSVSFTLERGTLLSVLGPNGVGKSTLFRCVLGLLRKFSGTITLDGDSVRGMGAKELARRIAYIPQTHYPAFHYTVSDMVLMGTTPRLSPFSPPGRGEEETAREAMRRVGIEELAGRYFTKLSGGERQLVLIARALAQRTNLLIMDEPTASLDYGNQIRVLSRIRALADEGYAVIQSTHNPEQAFLFSHEILAMKDGRTLACGPPADVITPGLVKTLYGLDVEIKSLCDDRFRACIPKSVILEGNES